MTTKNHNTMVQTTAEKMTQKEADDFYAATKTRLHVSLILFLCVYNGGVPEHALFNYTDLEGKPNTGEVLEFLPFSRVDKDDVLNVTERFQKEGRIGSHFLVVARESGGNLILVDNNTGNVFLWDHEKEEQSPENCYFLGTNSLFEFFHKKLSSAS